MTLLLFGARRRWITACARLIAASGSPTYSTARAAASAARSACGSARPTSSLARMTSRRDEARVLARFEHAREPVEARVGIGAADRLDERGDDVVVLVVAVADAAERERGFRVGERDRRAVGLDGERVRDLEHGEEVAGVALALVDEMSQRVVVDLGRLGAEAAFDVGERAVREARRARRRRAARAGTACCASSGPVSEKNGFSVVAPTSTSRPSSTNGSSTSCCAREKRWTSSRNRIVPCPRSPSRARARSATSRTSFTPALTALSVSNAFSLTPATRRAIVVLPGAGRTPEDERRQPVRLDQHPQRLARPEQVLLTDDLVERPRPQRAASGALCASRSSTAAANRSGPAPFAITVQVMCPSVWTLSPPEAG